jgi:hypothetical protein
MQVDGWAVIDETGLVILTVSPTRHGAIVNWLLSKQKLLVTRLHSEEEIEAIWLSRRGDAVVEPVAVYRQVDCPTNGELQREIAMLQSKVYVPGLWRCAKCEFQLIQANLNAGDGSVTARDQAGDKCPNCDVPLWRVSEREAGNRLVDEMEQIWIQMRERGLAVTRHVDGKITIVPLEEFYAK